MDECMNSSYSQALPHGYGHFTHLPSPTKTKLSKRNRQKLQSAEVKLMLQWPKARLLFCATGTTVAHGFDFGMDCFGGPRSTPVAQLAPRNLLTRWDVSSIPANGIFLTKN